MAYDIGGFHFFFNIYHGAIIILRSSIFIFQLREIGNKEKYIVVSLSSKEKDESFSFDNRYWKF
jgi:hypothetical protein